MNSRFDALLALVAFLPTFGCSASGGGGGGNGVDQGGSSNATGGTGAIITSGTGGTGGTGAVIDPNDPTDPNNTECDSTLEVTYRDFTEAHPDFEMDFRGDVVRRGLVSPMLGADKKPDFLNTVGCPGKPMTAIDCDNWSVTTPVLSTAEAFAQWYTDTADVNIKIEKQLALTETAAGSGQYAFDSTSFFPLDASEGFGVSPAGHYTGKNYLFTTEIHVQFGYRAGQKFTFRGDDDLWIFVNGKLALDLGSLHGPEEGTIDFDAQAAALGIAVGQTYPMDIFHAERHTDGSNFRVTTNISCFTDVIVR